MSESKVNGTVLWIIACIAAVAVLTMINDGLIVLWVLVGIFAAMAPLLSNKKESESDDS